VFVWTTNPWERIDGRDVEAPAQPSVDGTYRWTITEDDALTSHPDPLSPEDLATFPWVFTVTLEEGMWFMRHYDGEGSFVDCGDCTYTIDDDTISFEQGGVRLDFTFTSDEHGNLHLEPSAGPRADPGGDFVMTTKPWERLD
jgi:hypothetical protein